MTFPSSLQEGMLTESPYFQSVGDCKEEEVFISDVNLGLTLLVVLFRPKLES